MNSKNSLYSKLKKYEVKAASLEEFCEKYHKPFDNTDFGKMQREDWLKSAKKEFEKFGYVMIPSGTTTTGAHAVWYGNKEVYND